MSNDTTASSGVLFNPLGAPVASSQGPCTTPPSGVQPSPCVTTSTNKPAGLVSIQNSAVLTANLPATITCPAGHFVPGTNANNGTCRRVSDPPLANHVCFPNPPFPISLPSLRPGAPNLQRLAALALPLSHSPRAPPGPGAHPSAIGGRG